MTIRPLVVVLGSLLAAGCAARPEEQTPTNHPAHPASAEAPLPPASETLALHGRHRSASGADGAAAGDTPPATRPVAGAAAAAPVYTCAHHPEVIADAPGDCPKCGMKLTPRATQPSGPTGPAGHRHDNAASDDAPGGHGGHR